MSDELGRLRALATAVAAYRQALDIYQPVYEETWANYHSIDADSYTRACKLSEDVRTRQSEMFQTLDRLTAD